MNKFFTLCLLFALFCPSVLAQCTETDEPRVLLVGDSWAFFMSVDQTLNRALEKWGHSHYTFVTNTVVAENGAETDDFLKPEKQAEILTLLNDNPSIQVVHLSIGGNDFLGDWNINFTQAQTDSLIQTVEVRLLQVIDFLKSAKPGIRILWSGYTYTNFEEVIEDSAPFQTNHPFYDTWEGMGFPNFLQINQLLGTVSNRMKIIADTDPQVDFVNVCGILQYTFGQNDPVTVPPGGTYPAFTAPLPYGYPDYPTPKEAMRDYFLTKDCFHLSPQGYDDMVSYQMQKFYHKYLMDDQYFLAEGTNQNGAISNNGLITNTLKLGEDAGENYTTHLSFNTTTMPDTILTAASIFLRRKNLNGTNPITNNLQLKIINGNFGASADIEASDLSATPDATDTPCLFGSKDKNGDWIRLDLPASMLPYINNDNPTQFLLSAPAASGGFMDFEGIADPDFTPVLNLTFKNMAVDVAEDLAENTDFSLFPNPNTGIVFLNNPTVTQVEIYNILGEKVLEPVLNHHKIDISVLPAGVYFVYQYAGKQYFVSKIVKI